MRDDGSIVTERVPLPKDGPDPGVALLLPIQQIQPGIHITTNPYTDRWDDARLVVLVRAILGTNEMRAHHVRVKAMAPGPAGMEATGHALLWHRLERAPEAIARTLEGPDWEDNFLEIGDGESERATPPRAGAYEITVDGPCRHATVRTWVIRATRETPSAT
jgi:hypothetical protein